EDGIRDLTVTGVQSVLFRSTSAPVSVRLAARDGDVVLRMMLAFGEETGEYETADPRDLRDIGRILRHHGEPNTVRNLRRRRRIRSEERRVGKEWRTRWRTRR